MPKRESRNVRTQLIHEARRLIEAEGLADATLRAIAREVGITPMASYRHFADGRRELLAVVATVVFTELTSILERRTGDDPLETLLEMSLRYVQFGVERPHLYRALFNVELADPLAFHDTWEEEGTITPVSAQHYRDLDRVKLNAFVVIVAALRHAQNEHLLDTGDVEEYGLALAALLHGLVGEFIDEGLYRRASTQRPWSGERKKMSRRVVQLLIAGFAHEGRGNRLASR